MITKTAGRLALVFAVLFSCGTAVAESGKAQPFKIHGTLYLTPMAEMPAGFYTFIDIGEATILGRYYNTGWLQFNADLTIHAGDGTCTAANGDSNDWVMQPDTGRVIFLGGTGRFEGATGYFDSKVTSMVPDPDDGTITSAYIGKGEIIFPKKDKK